VGTATKQMIDMSKLHTFLLLRRTVAVSATDLRGAVSPKPGAADYVPPCKETYVQKVVEPGLMPPKLSTLCYAHAAPRQPRQLPDYTLMYAHIGRLAILHISNVKFICT
jgi:hypothetical protein